MSRIREVVTTGILVIVMFSIVLLISGQFRYRLIVIATPSMTGSINEGDAIIYEDYDGQPIEEETVVVFTTNEKNLIVHRVVDIKQENGIIYYTTKGDANDSADAGYITEENLRGVVLFKLPYIGQVSLWLRDLFK